MSKDVKFHKDVEFEKGTINIWSVVLAGANTMIITKNGTDETTSECDILYITRTSFLCRFRI
jgi:hypothetical protein